MSVATRGVERPNAAHEALAELERRGLLDGVITQNIDRLHRAAGSREVVEVHGSIASSTCASCGEPYGIEQIDAEGVAICSACGVGSSLVVQPVAGLPGITLSCGGQLAIVTKSATPYDGEAVLRLEGEVDVELGALVAALPR